MGNDKKLPAWIIRVDDVPGQEFPPAFWEFVKTPGLFCCKELGALTDSPNPHYHVATRWEPPESKQTIINRIKKLFPWFTKSDFAVSEWKTYDLSADEAYIYLCKGSDKDTLPQIIFNRTLHDVKTLHARYWAKNAELKKKPKDSPLCEQVYDLIGDQLKDLNFENKFDLICDTIMSITRGKVNDNIAFPHVQAVLYRVDPATTALSFRYRMMKKYESAKFNS